MTARPPSEEKPPLTLESVVELDDLYVHREPGRPPLLGCRRVRRLLEVEEDTLTAVHVLTASKKIGEADRVLSERTGNSYDLLHLAETLRQRGFIRTIDGVPLEREEDAAERHPVLHAIPPRLLRWMHHPITIGSVGLLVGTWLALLVANPWLRPSYQDLFLFASPGLVVAFGFLGILFMAHLHELAHFFVARSFGVDATLRISHRYFLVVLVTDVTNAWVLPIRQRLAIFLAGIGFNLTVASLAGLALAAVQAGLLHVSGTWVAALRFLVFLNVFPLAFQLFIFARTDLYHVLLAFTRQRNLAQNAGAYLRFKVRRAWRSLRGETRRPCIACHAATFPDDPFCYGCGADLPVDNPNKYPFTYRDRRILLACGVLFVLGSILGYSYFLSFGLRFQIAYVLLTHDYLQNLPKPLSLGHFLNGFWLAFTALLQVTLTVYFLGKRLLDLGKSLYTTLIKWLTRDSTTFEIVAELRSDDDSPTTSPHTGSDARTRPVAFPIDPSLTRLPGE